MTQQADQESSRPVNSKMIPAVDRLDRDQTSENKHHASKPSPLGEGCHHSKGRRVRHRYMSAGKDAGANIPSIELPHVSRAEQGHEGG